MTILKQNGYEFPALQRSDLDFDLSDPSLIVCNCETDPKVLSAISCVRCFQKTC